MNFSAQAKTRSVAVELILAQISKLRCLKGWTLCKIESENGKNLFISLELQVKMKIGGQN